jgi:hypothetical protein
MMVPLNCRLLLLRSARRLKRSSERIRQLARSGRLVPDQETELGRLWLPETVEAFAATRGRGRFDARPSTGDQTGKEVQ